MAIFLALGTGFLLVSYSLIPANFANTIGLFTTVVTAVLSSWLFRERLRSTEWWLIAISTILLCVFIILP